MKSIKIKKGNYTALYFLKVKRILKKETNKKTILQFSHFNMDPIYVYGIDECVKIIKKTLGTKVNVYGKKDGDLVSKNDPILLIEGDYKNFCILENIIDGILAEASTVYNNTKKIVSLVGHNRMIYMNDRAYHYSMQSYYGNIAYAAGARKFVTKEQIKSLKEKKDWCVVGTMPHALIQQCSGNIKKACEIFHKSFPHEELTALIDYKNDVTTAIEQIKKLDYVKYVRVDTSKNMIDKSIEKTKSPENYGVSPILVKNIKKQLEKVKRTDIKIIASSGFNYDKIKDFEENKIPVDIYGVGASLLLNKINISGDCVLLNNQHEAKKGRELKIKLDELNTLVKYA